MRLQVTACHAFYKEAIMENEGRKEPKVPPEKSSASYAYSLCIIKFLRKGDWLTQEEYERVEKVVDSYYQSA